MSKLVRSWGILAIALVACVALFAAACGDDDSGGNVAAPGSNSSSGTGSDQAYVSTICKAAAKFSDDISTATKDPTKLTDPTALANLFTKPFEDYVNALKQAKPPADVKSYNDQLIKALDDALTSLKQNGSLDALSSFGDNIPEPPKDVSDRLENVAKSNADCTKAGFNFNGTSGN